MEFDGFVVGFNNKIQVEFFIVGQGVDGGSLLGERTVCWLAASSDPLLRCFLWVAFQVGKLDSERSVSWLFWWRGVH